MMGLVFRLEYYMQSLRRGLTSIFSIPGASGNDYHIVLIFLVLALTIPIVSFDVATAPAGGIGILGAETGFFFMLVFLAVAFIMSVFLAPLGILLL
jgi:hypothetical protein